MIVFHFVWKMGLGVAVVAFINALGSDATEFDITDFNREHIVGAAIMALHAAENVLKRMVAGELLGAWRLSAPGTG